jgi:GNAT superfamily N-acetyltransferase
MEIVEANQSDIPRLQEILESAIEYSAREYYTEDEIASLTHSYTSVYSTMIPMVGSEVLVAKDGDKITGFGAVELDFSVIESLFVSPQRMGEGIGSTILSVIEERLKSVGKRGSCVFSSLNAVEFYGRNGYKKHSERMIDAPDGSEVPAVLMWKDFDDMDGDYDLDRVLNSL